MTAMLVTLNLMSPQSPKVSTRRRPRHAVTTEHTMEAFIEELGKLFERPLRRDLLQGYSTRLQRQYQDRLAHSPISMLPSYNHTLPTGEETGDCLALDVGGSTFRVALIRLSGRMAEKSMTVRHSTSYEINDGVKSLEGQAFFDWMAGRIGESLSRAGVTPDKNIPMGLAWSFPVEQTSPRSGRLLTMGKGFQATTGLIGQDLSEIIMRSCRAMQLPVEMRAIVNDAAATLLSQAYLDSSARMSLILGTGMNSAVYLPVSAVAPQKFGVRPESWHAEASHVLVNTELSMFGRGIMPCTRWDEALHSKLPDPDFQPMEYWIGGMYLGEIVRLVLLEAIDKAGLFSGERPDNFDTVGVLKTRTISVFEADTTSDLREASAYFQAQHSLRRASKADWQFVRAVVKHVSRRAQAYLATALHALWVLRKEAEGLEAARDCHMTVACNGTVIEKYPGFRSNCQRILDEMCSASGAAGRTISLEMAPESSIYGAAVAVSCVKDI